MELFMTTTTTFSLSEAEFCKRFLRAAELYARKIEGLVFSVTDAAVAATAEARVPLFATQLQVAIYVRQYVTAADQKKQEILSLAYKLHNPPIAA